MDNPQEDSPLSITAHVAGILTFVIAIFAAAYVRITYLRNSDREYFQVKMSLAWYKTDMNQNIKSTASSWMTCSGLGNAYLNLSMRWKRVGSEDEQVG
ncbi:hypothetical protein F5B21DRAFT_502685 [Xylaria acuta]|nr:hypothetical protein F5B21DRAFT_502685 [Xylaria acuta]